MAAALRGYSQSAVAADVDQSWAALERAARPCTASGRVAWRKSVREAKREAAALPVVLRYARRRAGLLRAALRARASDPPDWGAVRRSLASCRVADVAGTL